MRKDKKQRISGNLNSSKKSFTLESVQELFSASLIVSRGFQILSCLSIIWGLEIFASTNDFSGLLLFVLSSISFFRNAWKVDKTKEYRAIVSIIITDRIRSIDKIAETVKLPYDLVRKDLQILIDKVKLTDIAIDDTRREVILS